MQRAGDVAQVIQGPEMLKELEARRNLAKVELQVAAEKEKAAADKERAKKVEVWDSFSRPPQTALKTIKGGRLQGMTDVNPQWRYRAMTEAFGPCGIGWKYKVVRLWTEPGPGAEVMAFAEVELFVKIGKEWSEPIPGIGGNALVAVETKGPRGNDECYKMAITDALSVAMKMLGVASDIYMGLWDGSKYREEPEKPEPKPKAEPTQNPEPKPKAEPTQKPGCLAPDQTDALWRYARKLFEGATRANMKVLLERHKVERTADLPVNPAGADDVTGWGGYANELDVMLSEAK